MLKKSAIWNAAGASNETGFRPPPRLLYPASEPSRRGPPLPVPIIFSLANGGAATSTRPNDEPGSTAQASLSRPQPAPPRDDTLTAAFWNFHSRPRSPNGPGEREGGAEGARARESSVTPGGGLRWGGRARLLLRMRPQKAQAEGTEGGGGSGAGQSGSSQ